MFDKALARSVSSLLIGQLNHAILQLYTRIPNENSTYLLGTRGQ